MTFAARPQDHSQKVNRKMYRAAMRSIFSELLRQDRLLVVDALDIAGDQDQAAWSSNWRRWAWPSSGECCW